MPASRPSNSVEPRTPWSLHPPAARPSPVPQDRTHPGPRSCASGGVDSVRRRPRSAVSTAPSGPGSRAPRRCRSGGGRPRRSPRSSSGSRTTRRCRSSRIWPSPSRVPLVFPPEHERAALPPPGAAEPPLPLDHRPAATRAVAEPALVDRRRVAGADHLAGVADDLAHEPPRVQAAALDLAELRLPLAGQLRALQAPVLDQRHEVAAQVRRGQRLLLPRDVAPRQQGLDDRGPRRRRAQALAP